MDGRVLLALVAAFAVGAVWVGKMMEFKTGTTKLLQEVREDVKKILARLGPSAVSAESPLRLTDLGREISAEIDAETVANSLAASFGRQAAEMQPYEIQDFCFDYVRDRFRPEPAQIARMRKSAYDHGVSIDVVNQVLAIELRDRLVPSPDPLPSRHEADPSPRQPG